MQRLPALDPESTTGRSKDLFNAVQSKLGMIPNMMRTMGNSPAMLNGYLSFNAALAESSIGGKLGELIALTVANANNCEYCNTIHSFISEKLMHIDTAAIADAREGRSSNGKTEAALVFARALVSKRGEVSDSDLAALRDAGYRDAAIAEIIGHTALNILTNYFNNAAKVTVDFPLDK